ncbi:Hypothetical protein SMAX5B_009551 [Scophthalmus maximus]|uniref:Uncharacterized protein n=1 Tax=Scophthalmus maximus TaxID=52904 RepID=A0A2U9AZH8_SCOMX|nr:Hypothetical protein SMAX5B_009551 [Scophthalmus maximus]
MWRGLYSAPLALSLSSLPESDGCSLARSLTRESSFWWRCACLVCADGSRASVTHHRESDAASQAVGTRPGNTPLIYLHLIPTERSRFCSCKISSLTPVRQTVEITFMTLLYHPEFASARLLPLLSPCNLLLKSDRCRRNDASCKSEGLAVGRPARREERKKKVRDVGLETLGALFVNSHSDERRESRLAHRGEPSYPLTPPALFVTRMPARGAGSRGQGSACPLRLEEATAERWSRTVR